MGKMYFLCKCVVFVLKVERKAGRGGGGGDGVGAIGEGEDAVVRFIKMAGQMGDRLGDQSVTGEGGKDEDLGLRMSN